MLGQASVSRSRRDWLSATHAIAHIEIVSARHITECCYARKICQDLSHDAAAQSGPSSGEEDLQAAQREADLVAPPSPMPGEGPRIPPRHSGSAYRRWREPRRIVYRSQDRQ